MPKNKTPSSQEKVRKITTIGNGKSVNIKGFYKDGEEYVKITRTILPKYGNVILLQPF